VTHSQLDREAWRTYAAAYVSACTERVNDTTVKMETIVDEAAGFADMMMQQELDSFELRS